MHEDETIHTNQKHPFLTVEAGFVPVSSLNVGMHLVEGNGQIAIIEDWLVITGSQTMYNLTVQQDHTYTVGNGQFVVHNCGTSGTPDPAKKVEGQPDLYRGERYDSDMLRRQGWKSGPGDGRDGNYISDNFKDFLRSQGEDPSDWRYRMEDFNKKGNATIKNHYWYKPGDPDAGFFHHH